MSSSLDSSGAQPKRKVKVKLTKSRYWFGEPDAEGRNLATCIWRSREDARKGGVGPAHRKAAGSTRFLYSNWKIDRHRLIIRDGIESWDIVDWVDEN